MWVVDIPPSRFEHFDIDQEYAREVGMAYVEEYCDVLSPWGVSYWNTWDDAFEFVREVFTEYGE